MVAYCDVRLEKECVIGLRPRYLRVLDGGANRAAASAANVALATPLLIRSQAVAVPMEETLALGADDLMVPVHPEKTGPGFTSTSPALRRSSRRCRAGWAAPVVEKGGLCASHSASLVCWAGFEDLRPKAASPHGKPRKGSGSLSPHFIALELSIVLMVDSSTFNVSKPKKDIFCRDFCPFYADDAAFPNPTADGRQRSHDIMSENYHRAGLIINKTNTPILRASSSESPTFSISGNRLRKSENFTDFYSNHSFYGYYINGIKRRIYLSSSAFGRLSKRVFGNQNLTIRTNIAVYDAVVITTILYGCEKLDPYRRHVGLLELFHIRQCDSF